MSGDFAIIVRGLTEDVGKIKSCFSNYSDRLIFSCWEGDQPNYSTNDKVVFNSKIYPDPHDPVSFIYQKTTALTGLKMAETLGYQYAVLTRSDLLFNNAKDVISIFDFEKLNFLCWHNHIGGYFVDYFMAGRIDHLKIIWDASPPWKSGAPEKIITEKYINNLRDQVKVNFVLKELNDTRDILWTKWNVPLSRYAESPHAYTTDTNIISTFQI